MKQFITITLFALIFSVKALALSPINTTHPYGMGACIGLTCQLFVDSSSGGVWSSSNTAIATVDATGLVTGVSAGSATITYSVALSYVTATFYVTAPPAAITGTGTICPGATLTLSDATAGGSWTSDATVASVNSMTGLVTGISPGDQLIYFVVGTGCYATTTVTVNGTTVASIDSSISSVCAGSSITLTDATSGGTWSSSNPAVGTINAATGVITGIAAGTTMVSYTVPGSCGPTSATIIIMVSNTTGPVGTISGPTVVYLGGSSIALADVGGTSGGSWTSSNPSVGTIDASTGVVTGVSLGTVTLTYSITGCGGTLYTTQIDTVENFGGISGNVIFSTPYYGSVKVWLITYNPSTLDLEAVDSQYASGSGSSYYYQFNTAATDSFRVKAGVNDTSGIITGFIPTYHDSFFYWHDANVINHTLGVGDINENVYMLSGTPTPGPGFIGGNVTTGANRATSGSIPSIGMKIFAVNTTSGSAVQMTRTDATGAYSFSSLPYGTYTLFPDSLNYATTPYTSVTISAAVPTINTIGFVQHTLSKTITPLPLSVNSLTTSISSVFAFPNPTNGKLNIQWIEKVAEKGTITVSDITGREVYKSTINMNEGNGSKAIDLSGLINGLYMINVKSTSLNYNNKIEIQH